MNFHYYFSKDVSMFVKIPIKLGICATHDLTKVNLSKWIDTIEDFGVTIEELHRLRPSTDDIFNFYQNIIFYRKSVRYLKEMKVKMNFDIN